MHRQYDNSSSSNNDDRDAMLAEAAQPAVAEEEEETRTSRVVRAIVEDPRWRMRLESAETLTEPVRQIMASAFFMCRRGPMRNHLDSYDRFINTYIPRIVKENSCVYADGKWITAPDGSKKGPNLRVVIHFGQTTCSRPSLSDPQGEIEPLLPSQARRRSFTYAVSLTYNVRQTVFDVSEVSAEELAARGSDCKGLKLVAVREVRDALLCQVACPLGVEACHLSDSQFLCDECPEDPPGYFILNGSEKVVVTQKRMRNNYPFVYADRAGSRYDWRCEVRSLNELKHRSTSTLYIYLAVGRGQTNCVDASLLEGGVVSSAVTVPYLDVASLPLAAVMRYLGVRTRRAMVDLILEHADEIAICRPYDDEHAWVRKPPAKLVELVEAMVASSMHSVKRGVQAMLAKARQQKRQTLLAAAAVVETQEQRVVGDGADNGAPPPAPLPLPGGGGNTNNDNADNDDNDDDDRDSEPDWFSYANVAAWIAQQGVRDTRANVPTSNDQQSEDQALEASTRRRLRRLDDVMASELLPHVSLERSPDDVARKAYYLAGCMCKLACVALGLRDQDDRDAHQICERMGRLLATRFRSEFRKRNKNMTSRLRASLESAANPTDESFLARLLNDHNITMAMSAALRTGNMGGNGGSGSSQACISQVHSRMNHVGAHSLLAILMGHKHKEGKNAKPRQLRPSDYGDNCANQTPEGQGTCGIVRNRASISFVRNACEVPVLLDVLKSLDESGRASFLPFASCSGCADMGRQGGAKRRSLAPVVVNGSVHGFTRDAQALAKALREARRHGSLPSDVGICHLTPGQGGHSRSPVELSGEEGVVIRPVIRVDSMARLKQVLARFKVRPNHTGHEGPFRPALTVMPVDPDAFVDVLVSEGIVEFVNSHEAPHVAPVPGELVTREELEQLAAQWDIMEELRDRSLARAVGDPLNINPFDHVEVHPMAVIQGVASSLTPHSDRNQGPRNSYAAGMTRQARGLPCLNMSERSDASLQCLWYPQAPLVRTFMEMASGSARLPAGFNAMVLIGAFYGRNVEDALVVSRRLVDLGGFRVTYLRTFRDEEKQHSTDVTRFCVPPAECRGRRIANYDTVGPNGYAEPGTFIRSGDVVLGKVTIVQAGGKRATHDSSTIYRGTDDAVVESVIDTTNRDGFRSIKIVLRFTRKPEQGDKFCSRHGQKGVNGLVVNPEDMPFNAAGETPDIIMNPHAYPSRMTYAMLLEALQAITGCESGLPQDGTAFSDLSVAELMDYMEERGMIEPEGKTIFTDGQTGEMMPCRMFYAPFFFQSLKQLASEKMHTRQRGPYSLLTRQPTEGKLRHGGLRLGDMERVSFKSYGAQYAFEERFFKASDATLMHICTKPRCGQICQPGSPVVAQLAEMALGADGKLDHLLDDDGRTRRRIIDTLSQGSMVASRGSRPYCLSCRSHDGVVAVNMPFVYKLIQQYLLCVNTTIRPVFSTLTDSGVVVLGDHVVERQVDPDEAFPCPQIQPPPIEASVPGLYVARRHRTPIVQH
ncbi:DNA-directed RNA polymerase II subunit RPB2 [Mollivirus sibericum]|uniref:DNA-directed RNA polymerase II subunit RPB2 n=1 Tax=Mollivirus sibericum TaxID=1678078 RepID=UPI0006B2E67A|nr:DNA-directed RNA polymerase II subunit RPB2 [Mollivirus sibericum]ALD62173.1 DNA-directed RNA polymerase II subunit RPB2 [Mollivirus sibericum]